MVAIVSIVVAGQYAAAHLSFPAKVAKKHEVFEFNFSKIGAKLL